jgi:hypothetical protein
MVHHIEYTRRAWLHMCVGELRNPHLVLLHTHLVLPQPLPLSVLLTKTDMWMYSTQRTGNAVLPTLHHVRGIVCQPPLTCHHSLLPGT